MDSFDRKILALYQSDTRRIAAEIGERVGLSAAAVQRRLKRLRAEGAIAREAAELDPVRAGFPLSCIVTLSLAPAAESHLQLDRFKRLMRADTRVQQCWHVTGPTDFILVVVAPSMEAFADFARERLEADPTVARFDTFVALSRVKTGTALPL